jgi:metal-sulfur cluster biosynthetic enzyme
MAEESPPPSDDAQQPLNAQTTAGGGRAGAVSSAGGQFAAPGSGQQPVPTAAPVTDEQPVAPAPGEEPAAAAGEQGAASGPGEAAVSEEDVLDALANVIDPELGLDFVELGLIYGVEMSGGDVRVTFTLTTPACPIGPHVTEQIEEFVGELEGVTSVSTEMVFVPPWSPERMTEDAKFALGF